MRRALVWITDWCWDYWDELLLPHLRMLQCTVSKPYTRVHGRTPGTAVLAGPHLPPVGVCRVTTWRGAQAPPPPKAAACSAQAARQHVAMS